MGPMTSPLLGLTSLCLLTYVCAVAAWNCPSHTCSTMPTLWVNTSSMFAAIDGTKLTVYPRHSNGDLYDQASASLSIDAFGEITQDANGTCNTGLMYFLSQYIAADRIPRYLETRHACCSGNHFVEIMEGDIRKESVVINVTVPEWPEFYIEYTVSSLNESLSIPRPPTPEIGEGYQINYFANKIKLDVNLHHWPWITDEMPEAGYNDTFLQVFFTSTSHLDEIGHIKAYDAEDGKTLHFSAKSRQVSIQIDFLKIYTADDVDYFSHTNDLPVTTLQLEFDDRDAFLPAILSICDGNYSIVPRYDHLLYDPNLNALFIGDTTNTKPGPGKTKIPLWIIGPVLGVICLAALAVVLIIKIPAIRSFVLPHRARAESIRTTRDTSTKNTQRNSNWVSSTTPPTI